MLQVGDIVTVNEPFAVFYPGTWVIEAINPETGAYQIAGGVDFDAVHLTKVEE